MVDLAKMIVEKRQAEKRQAKRRQAKEWQSKKWRAIIRYVENEPVLLRDVLPDVMKTIRLPMAVCRAMASGVPADGLCGARASRRWQRSSCSARAAPRRQCSKVPVFSR